MRARPGAAALYVPPVEASQRSNGTLRQSWTNTAYDRPPTTGRAPVSVVGPSSRSRHSSPSSWTRKPWATVGDRQALTRARQRVSIIAGVSSW